MPVECESIEHGKQLAQIHFENVVKSHFFE